MNNIHTIAVTTQTGLTNEAMLSQVRIHEEEFSQLILQRLGLVVQGQKKEFINTILEACQKFHCTPDEYLQLLKTCSEQSPIIEHLIIGITIGETYFFRDKRQMQLLQENILPTLIKEKRKENNLSLRIWSAGCASGEEIYTITMLLTEMLPDLNKWSLSLMGTDINTVSLQKAINGRYSEWSMRSISDYFKNHYFTEEKSQYTLNSQIRSLVNFTYLNLNDDDYPSIFTNTNAQDLILCRNVLIYFDSECTMRLMKKFNQCLVPGGYLLLGASDPINIVNTNLIFHHQQGSLFSRPLEFTTALHKPPSLPSIPLVTPTQKISDIKKPVSSIIPASVPTARKPTHAISHHDVINKLVHEGKWQEVIATISLYKNHDHDKTFLLTTEAVALANLGKLDAATTICQDLINLNSADKNIYLTYALILTECNQLTEAEKMLRKTLFLDHQFAMGHFQLGLLLLRNKQREAGVKSLQNALKIAVAKYESDIVLGSQSLTYGHLADILKHEINLYVTEDVK